MSNRVSIGQIRAGWFETAGLLLVRSYSNLDGMPSRDEQPEYYSHLANVSGRVATGQIEVYVAIDKNGTLAGTVDFLPDVASYGAESAITSLPNTAGIRLLAVDPEYRGLGLGRRLAQFCIDRAKSMNRERIALHTTKAMQTAWGLYLGMGFVRNEALDFRQGELEVFGFELSLTGTQDG